MGLDMRGITTNLLEIILLIIGLAVVAFFIIYFGNQAQGKTLSIMSLMNSLKGV